MLSGLHSTAQILSYRAIVCTLPQLGQLWWTLYCLLYFS